MTSFQLRWKWKWIGEIRFNDFTTVNSWNEYKKCIRYVETLISERRPAFVHHSEPFSPFWRNFLWINERKMGMLTNKVVINSMLSLHTRRVSMDISYSTEVLKDKLENRKNRLSIESWRNQPYRIVTRVISNRKIQNNNNLLILRIPRADRQVILLYMKCDSFIVSMDLTKQ